MTDTTDVTVEPNSADGNEPPAGGSDTATVEPAARRTPMPKLGVWSWAFVGFTAAAVIVVIVLGALSEIVLPMTSPPCWPSSSGRSSGSSNGTRSSPPWPPAWSCSACCC